MNKIKLGKIYRSMRTGEYVVPIEFINIIEAQFVKYHVIETGNHSIMKFGDFLAKWRINDE